MMKSMQKAFTYLLLSLPLVTPCPFSGNVAGDAPDDPIHHRPGLRRRRRLTALSDEPETREKLNAIVANRAAIASKQRSLQTAAACVSEETYDAIYEDIVQLSETFLDNVSRAQ